MANIINLGASSNPVFIGATPTQDGSAGILPGPSSGSYNYYLKGDGFWTDVPRYYVFTGATTNKTGWDAVKGSYSSGILTIECQNTSSTDTVSWLVIGERHDPFMINADWTDENGKVIVEPLK